MKYLKLKVIQNLNARANCITKKKKHLEKKDGKKNLFSSMKYGACSIFMHKIEMFNFCPLKYH